MIKRRQFLKIGIGFPVGLGLVLNPLFSLASKVFAMAPKRTAIIGSDKKDPAVMSQPGSQYDTDLTDLRDFQTMGTTDYEVDLDEWRLKVFGLSKSPLSFTYQEILKLPSIEKKITLVCPGFFANTGLWKGLSIKELMENIAVDKHISRVVISGPEKPYTKRETFTLEDILTDKVFLAYGVNGETLPKRNGFPLRVAAEGHTGSEWVKYVYKISFEK